MTTWQRQAAAWLRGKAAEQAKTNDRYPDHAKCYPSWVERVKVFQQLADELEHEAAETPDELREVVALAYGYLWHVNDEPAAPVRLYSPQSAAYAARRLLRDTLTHEQRGEAINKVRTLLGTPSVELRGGPAVSSPERPA